MKPKQLVYLGGVILVLAASILRVHGQTEEQHSGKPGCCQYKSHGGHKGRDPEHRADMQGFHFLLAHRDQIHRQVTQLPNGVETVTESDDREVAAKLYDHVEAMSRRVKEQRPIHRRDPLFAEIFRHGDKITMEINPTDKGVKVTETADDPYVVKLIQAHAEVVTQFLANGWAEMHKNHPVPPR